MILEPTYNVPNNQLNKGAQLSYKWFDNNNLLENETNPTLIVIGNEEECESTTIEGKHNYHVEVYNNLHGATTQVPVKSGTYTIAYPPSQFTVAEISGNVAQGGQVEFTYSLVNPMRSEEVVVTIFILHIYIGVYYTINC